ncbi:MAG: STAS domain-containing protein, partial [Vicinamibacteria bacterium]
MLKVQSQEGRSFTRTMTLDGRLDAETVADFDVELDKALESPMKVLVFDLAKLEYISSAGLRSIFRAQKAMKARAGKVLLVNVKPQIQKVLDIVKAVDVGSVFRSVEELDHYL